MSSGWKTATASGSSTIRYGNRFWVLDDQIEITALTGGQIRLVNAGESVSVNPDGVFKNEEFEMPVDPRLDLATGTLALEATSRTEDGQVDSARVVWSISGSGSHAPVDEFTDNRRSLHLLAGRYTVTGTHDGQVREKTVDLATDANETVSFQFDITPAMVSAPDSAPWGN